MLSFENQSSLIMSAAAPSYLIGGERVLLVSFVMHLDAVSMILKDSLRNKLLGRVVSNR